jgi:hypothetical protein
MVFHPASPGGFGAACETLVTSSRAAAKIAPDKEA